MTVTVGTITALAWPVTNNADENANAAANAFLMTNPQNFECNELLTSRIDLVAPIFELFKGLLVPSHKENPDCIRIITGPKL